MTTRAHCLQPPSPLPAAPDRPVIFLAGSIEMGAAEPWQPQVERALADLPVLLLNPRRDDWDSAAPQDPDADYFRQQVTWELDGLELADHILLYLSPGTRSPISLLELGLFARSGKLLIACPEGFWRRGNVQIVARRYGADLFDSLEALVEALRQRLAAPHEPRSL
jgi:hypothetical protein